MNDQPNAPQRLAPEGFDFPTPEEIDLAKKAGIILPDGYKEDFSQLAALLGTIK